MASVVATQQQTSTSKPKATALPALFKHPALLSLLLALATVALYFPVNHHPFINYDDNEYVYENPQVLSGLNWATIKWAFTAISAANWHPVTWLTHAAVCQLFGADPAGHHDANVLFHALNVVLLFWVLFTGDWLCGSQLRSRGAVCAASHQRRVGSLGRGAQDTAQHVVLSARAGGLRLVCSASSLLAHGRGLQWHSPVG